MQSTQEVAVHAECVSEVPKDRRNTYMDYFHSVRSEWWGGGHWKHPLGEANKREGNRSAFTREHATVEDFRLSEGLLRSLAVLMLMS